jgi:cystathionine beta-lyase/cystathionine gamma-synthase
MDSFLALRGLKSLHVRMERHCTNAQGIAEYLSRHPKVAHVNYPGLAQHPNHAIAQAQMRFPGAMLSYVLKDDTAKAAARVMQRTQVFALAESLGGVESLISHPALMTHASMPPEQRLKVGINDSLTRVSVGIESLDDLLADLEQALA